MGEEKNHFGAIYVTPPEGQPELLDSEVLTYRKLYCRKNKVGRWVYLFSTKVKTLRIRFLTLVEKFTRPLPNLITLLICDNSILRTNCNN